MGRLNAVFCLLKQKHSTQGERPSKLLAANLNLYEVQISNLLKWIYNQIEKANEFHQFYEAIHTHNCNVHIYNNLRHLLKKHLFKGNEHWKDEKEGSVFL